LELYKSSFYRLFGISLLRVAAIQKKVSSIVIVTRKNVISIFLDSNLFHFSLEPNILVRISDLYKFNLIEVYIMRLELFLHATHFKSEPKITSVIRL
jgi:hypothetical protein